jgi:hypothetical protein
VTRHFYLFGYNCLQKVLTYPPLVMTFPFILRLCQLWQNATVHGCSLRALINGKLLITIRTVWSGADSRGSVLHRGALLRPSSLYYKNKPFTGRHSASAALSLSQTEKGYVYSQSVSRSSPAILTETHRRYPQSVQYQVKVFTNESLTYQATTWRR